MQSTSLSADGRVRFSNRQLFQLIWPLIVENFLSILVGMADSIMVAGVGEAAVSGVSLVDNINILMINAFTALGAGGAVVCGQYLGKRDLQKANRSANQLLLFMGALSVTVTAALYLLRPVLLHSLFGAIEPDVMAYANRYYLLVEASIPFLALYSAGAAVYRVMGNSAVAMKVSLLMNLINLAGNALLIYGFGWGVEGVAFPTLLARAVAAGVILHLLSHQDQLLHLSRPFCWHFEKETIGSIVKLGVPSGVESSIFQLGKLLLLSVASVFGTASIAANAIGNAVCNFQVLAASSVGTAMVTVISQCAGARDYEAIHFYTRRLMKIAYISMFCSNVVLLLLYPGILQIYHVSEEASRLAMLIILMHGGFGVLLWPASFTFPQALKATGDTRFVMAAAIFSMWVFRCGFGVWFAKGLGFGVLGIWMSMFIDWVFRILCFVIRWGSGRWKAKAL